MISAAKIETDQAARLLRVLWGDGHRSEIPYQSIRERCPCAHCRSQRETGRKPLSMALATKLLGWKRMGNYAAHFSWGDSHQDGIFAWDYLRTLCPCGACGPPRELV